MQFDLSSSLGKALQDKVDHRKEKSGGLWTLPEVSPGLVDFSSNDFLSLSKSQNLRSAFLAELTSEGNEFAIGSSSSRVFDGNSNYALSLEIELAKRYDAPAGLLFNSGFEANVSFFGYVPQPGDVVIYDELIHASVHDGMRISRAKKQIAFSHNCVADFEHVLEQCINEDEKVRSGEKNVFVAVEALYSMDGDTSPVAELIEILHQRLSAGNGYFVVDEAHSTGIIGDRGQGVIKDLGLESKVFARLHTFGKAPACTGAILLCSPLTRLYLINFARPFIYTTSMTFPSLAAIKVSTSIMQDEKTNLARKHTHELMSTLHTRLQALEARFSTHDDVGKRITVPKKCPGGAIIPLVTPKSLALTTHCRARGFSVNPVWAPMVPPGGERLRICVHAANTYEELDGLISAIEDWLLSSSDEEKEDVTNETPAGIAAEVTAETPSVAKRKRRGSDTARLGSRKKIAKESKVQNGYEREVVEAPVNAVVYA